MGIAVGKELTAPLIASLASTETEIFPEEETFVVACYPCFLPNLVGLNINEGHFFNAEVMASMLDYEPVAAKWLEVHTKIVSLPSLHIHDVTTIPTKFLPTLRGVKIKKLN